MKKNRELLAVLIAGCSICVAQAATDSPESVDQAWKKAMLAGDIEAVAALYATDATGWFPNEAPARGKESIRQSYAQFFADNTVTAAEVSNDQTQMCSDNAVRWGEYSLTIKPKKGGDTITMIGRFTEVLKKEGGNWVYAVDHASTNPSGAAGKP